MQETPLQSPTEESDIMEDDVSINSFSFNSLLQNSVVIFFRPLDLSWNLLFFFVICLSL